MAFNLTRFVRQTVAFNSGQLTIEPVDTPILANGPALFTYASADDSIATIGGANYFNNEGVIYDLQVGDLIICEGDDASLIYQVDTVDLTTSPKTITVVSFTPAGLVGTANIEDGAVTNAKLAADAVDTTNIIDAAVTSDKIDPQVLQYLAVPITAAQFNGMYATPLQVLATPGADKMIVIEQAMLLMTYVSAQYAVGGTVGLQYDTTAHLAAQKASTTIANTTVQGAASISNMLIGADAAGAFTGVVDKPITISNDTAAFTTGDSTFVLHLWYRIISTI